MERQEAVVGLVLGRLRGDGCIARAFTIPWRAVHRELAGRLGKAAADKLLPASAWTPRGLPAPGPVPEAAVGRSAHHLLKTLIGRHLTESVRAQHARAVTAACGPTVLKDAGTAPGPDEPAEVPLDTARGPAAFVESLRGSRDGPADLLLARMSALGVTTLLSPEEYTWLHQQIGEPVPGLPIGVAAQEPPAGILLTEPGEPAPRTSGGARAAPRCSRPSHATTTLTCSPPSVELGGEPKLPATRNGRFRGAVVPAGARSAPAAADAAVVGQCGQRTVLARKLVPRQDLAAAGREVLRVELGHGPGASAPVPQPQVPVTVDHSRRDRYGLGLIGGLPGDPARMGSAAQLSGGQPRGQVTGGLLGVLDRRESECVVKYGQGWILAAL
ncbi:hypothetical protein [Kitasatospora purpeofusca]|uniref:hypothetical protein n=1 Tax=Kitasatospora purpeofusca TaxID=67352 RepID=UPI0038695F98|nr:hypothetical protein OIP63_39030 [Kitasatospora purpeofusca]